MYSIPTELSTRPIHIRRPMWRIMASDSTQWPLEPHTAAKHEILRRYLNAWFPILGSYQGRVVFLDGFAGPGIYSHGESGSPIVALRALLEHSYFPRLKSEFVFWFLEPRRDRFESLQTRTHLRLRRPFRALRGAPGSAGKPPRI